MGDRTIRRLLVTALFRRSDGHVENLAFRESWIGRLIARKPIKLAAVALANKMARIAWAL